jgi:hypothetical protein
MGWVALVGAGLTLLTLVLRFYWSRRTKEMELLDSIQVQKDKLHHAISSNNWEEVSHYAADLNDDLCVLLRKRRRVPPKRS